MFFSEKIFLRRRPEPISATAWAEWTVSATGLRVHHVCDRLSFMCGQSGRGVRSLGLYCIVLYCMCCTLTMRLTITLLKLTVSLV